MGVELYSLAERPDLGVHPSRNDLFSVWSEFLLHDPVVNEHIGRLWTELPEFQTIAYDPDADLVLGEGDTVPVRWSGEPEPGGIDWALRQQVLEGGEPTTLCAVQVMINADAQGRGLSRLVLERMASVARDHGLDALIAPVRPTQKHHYPLIPMEQFIEWRRDDGELFDPWLRTHERLGASILAVAPESMTVPGSRADWEEWTGLQFPIDGDYVVPGALVPVEMRGGQGLYVEPNVWMLHPV